jgi:hypothetical protein
MRLGRVTSVSQRRLAVRVFKTNRLCRAAAAGRLLLVAVLLTGLGLAPSGIQGQTGSHKSRISLKNVEVPIRLEFAAAPVAVLRADRIRPAHHRWGFYQIGLLPVLACDGVSLEVCDAARAAQALAGLRDRLNAEAKGDVIEMHGVALRFDPEPGPRLEAAAVRFQDRGQWELTNLALRSGTNVLRAPRALLQVTGDQAGRLTWEAEGRVGFTNLFVSPTATHNP